MARVLVECAGCGASMKRTQREIDRAASGRLFCGIDCARRTGTKPTTRVETVCATCGAAITAKASRAGRTRFCSPACRARRGVPAKACDRCGALVPPGRTRFCSAGCAGNARRARVTSDCERCGRPVEYRDGERRRYCSRECSRAAAAANAVGHVTSTGYVVLRGRRRCRVVMEQVLGRPLLPGETVHHRNGIRDDDRPENLELWVSPSGRAQPTGVRAEDYAAWLRAELTLYGTPDERARYAAARR